MLFVFNNLFYPTRKVCNNVCLNKNRNKTFKFSKQRKIINLKMVSDEVWELDFFSRPVILDDGKKLWELIIVNKDKSLQIIESVPNNMVNSKELRRKLLNIINSAEKKPDVIKFFRAQMFNMISIALSDLDINVKPSRRTYALFEIIREREKTIYPEMIGYKPYLREYKEDLSLKRFPQRMPDILLGENFSFVLASLEEINVILKDQSVMKDSFKIDENKYDIDKIPGIVILSNRANSLANWINGLEVFSISFDQEKSSIVLDCSLDTKFLFAKIDIKKIQDGTKFENQKRLNSGFHFISVMSGLPENKIYGFWLLNESINIQL
ncbi:hypothetical protein [Guillardia theta]|uniref:Uncharacterized protein n=1 Tax=Guillardia theta TaxID=55529 RepID=Q9AVY7_GUITH|nr:hypothetical protein GTHECHR2175 [Guillardia theta]CAC27084.1 hypothetical protein [Guillardia theta]|mmetsp:Transcript_34558/g.108338  ORF Transcript_34558/g.108338 Transcript_34558/m.108338 type:complete len:324 (+) Transcript_34558:1870-2841(+)